MVLEDPDGITLKSQLSFEPLDLTNVWLLVVLVVLKINSIPLGFASFDHQSKARKLEPDDKFRLLNGSVLSKNETLPVVFFRPLSKSLTTLLVRILGLCSSIDPPYSVNLKVLVSYPYKFSKVFSPSAVPFVL